MIAAITLEPGADAGWAVKRNGTILLRTATETDWQARGNGLVLVFDYPAMSVDWTRPYLITEAWEREVARSLDALEIVRVRAVEIPDA